MSTQPSKEEGGISLGWLFLYIIFDFLVIVGLLGFLGKRAQDTAWMYCLIGLVGMVGLLALVGLGELARLTLGG